MPGGCRYLVDAPTDPPEAEPDEQNGDAEEDARFRPLQRPEVALGVVGQILAQTLSAEPLFAGRGRRGRAAVLRVARDRLAGAGHDMVGQHPCVCRRFGGDPQFPILEQPEPRQRAEGEGGCGVGGRGEVFADPQGHGRNGTDINGEGGGHCRQGAPNDHARRDTEDEREQCVADRDDAAGVVEHGRYPVTARIVDAVCPGGDRPAEQPNRCDRCAADEGELGGQPARVTDWFQARRYVPVSSSRAISGAPQKMPIRAGTRYIAYVARSYTVPLVPLLASSRKFSIALVQLLPQPATLAASYASAMLRAVRTRRTASTARPPTVIQVWVRNWRQVNQIIALSPKRATGRGRPVTDKRGLGLRG